MITLHFSSQLDTTLTSNLNFPTMVSVALQCCSLPDFLHLQKRVLSAHFQRRNSWFKPKMGVENMDQWSQNLISAITKDCPMPSVILNLKKKKDQLQLEIRLGNISQTEIHKF